MRQLCGHLTGELHFFYGFCLLRRDSKPRFDIWTSCRSPGIKDEGVVIRRDDGQKRAILVRAIHGVILCGVGTTRGRPDACLP